MSDDKKTGMIDAFKKVISKGTEERFDNIVIKAAGKKVDIDLMMTKAAENKLISSLAAMIDDDLITEVMKEIDVRDILKSGVREALEQNGKSFMKLRTSRLLTHGDFIGRVAKGIGIELLDKLGMDSDGFREDE